jgi:type I restriction enzyme S subunit
MMKYGIGICAALPEEIEPHVFDCHLIGARPNKSIVDYRYVVNYLNSEPCRALFISSGKTTTMTTLPQHEISDLRMVLPPIEEQQEIANMLEEKFTLHTNIVQSIEFKIEKLKEYTISIISAAVTGKIDVKGLA